MPWCYKYPRPALTVDALIVSSDGKVLLIQRKNPPFKGLWALPGGFVDMDETPEAAAVRELEEETGLTGIELTQFHTFGAVDRDPRHRTVSIVFSGYTANSKDVIPKANDDASDAGWFDIRNLPETAFDHKEIIDSFVNNNLKIL